MVVKSAFMSYLLSMIDFKKVLLALMPKTRIRDWMSKNALPYRELMAYYKCAMMGMETKFRVLDEELSLKYDHNPIESIDMTFNNFTKSMLFIITFPSISFFNALCVNHNVLIKLSNSIT